MRLDLDFHGVSVSIRAAAGFESILDDLNEDFAYFSRPSTQGPASIEITLLPHDRAARLRPRLPLAFKTRMCRVYGWGATRLCDYGQNAGNELRVFSRKSRQNPAGRKFRVIGSDAAGIYEATYIVILSSVGESLDGLGYHRIHALAFARDNGTALLPLRSGGGKSSIAALLLRDERYRLFSDEIPLLKEGKLYPFPIRIALLPPVAEAIGLDPSVSRCFLRRIFAEKVLLPVPPDRVAAAGKLDLLITADSRIQLIWVFFWGLGVPQMAEYMLRLDNTARLMRIAISRLREALLLLNGPARLNLELTADPFANKAKIDERWIQ
jgi:hypothetical protein